jgi:hypothetical protein
MARKLTITVEDDVYAALKTKVGARRISRFLNDLARPLVADAALKPGEPGAADRVADLLAEVSNEGC